MQIGTCRKLGMKLAIINGQTEFMGITPNPRRLTKQAHFSPITPNYPNPKLHKHDCIEYIIA